MYSVSEPVSPEDFAKIFNLRFDVLRAPWNQPRGSEKDENESSAIHALIKDKSGKCIASGRLQFNNAEEGQIRFMAVETEYRGQGLGKMILDFLEQKAKANNTFSIVLQARENALQFYERAGYINEGKSFLLFDSVQHYRMRKQL
jgi:predicted GNAT family N-acyltransferase